MIIYKLSLQEKHSLEKNKVILNKTNTSSTYVKMVLKMFFQGFGKTYQENQTYTFPF